MNTNNPLLRFMYESAERYQGQQEEKELNRNHVEYIIKREKQKAPFLLYLTASILTLDLIVAAYFRNFIGGTVAAVFIAVFGLILVDSSLQTLASHEIYLSRIPAVPDQEDE